MKRKEALRFDLFCSDLKGGVGGDRQQQVAEVIAYLNEKAGRSFSPDTSTTQRLIGARLKAGATVEQLKAVIDLKVGEWGDTDLAKYLRPATLFNQEKFESYVEELAARQADNAAPQLDEVGCPILRGRR